MVDGGTYLVKPVVKRLDSAVSDAIDVAFGPSHQGALPGDEYGASKAQN